MNAASEQTAPSKEEVGADESGEDDADLVVTNDASVPLTPPPTASSVTDDGGVLKVVLREGTGPPPTLHSRCLVHYVGRLCNDGSVFMDTQQDSQSGEPVKLVAGRDATLRETGLNLAVATMLQGERAAVYITDPAYGFGKAGSFSFPCVPPNAKLVYDITLVGWEEATEADNPRGMLFEERLEAAERRRLEGNKLFAEGKWREALAKYAMALSFVDEDFMMQLDVGPHLDKAQAITQPLHLNMAAAQIKMGDFTTAVYNCTQVLTNDPKNAKALFRRSIARGCLGQTQDAIKDCEGALGLAPGDAAVKRQLAMLRQAAKEERAASAKLFRGAFGPPPAAQPTSTAGQPPPSGANQQQRGVSPSAVQPSSASRVGQSPNAEQGGLIARLAAVIAAVWSWLSGLLASMLPVKRLQHASPSGQRGL